MFVAAGRTMLSANWGNAFANPAIQVGPLQLAAFGSVGRFPTALAIVLGVAAAASVVAAAYAAGVRRPLLIGGLGLVAVATGFTRAGFDSGHPADSIVPLLWVVAAADARRGRALRAGTIVGLSAGLETWGILGIAVLVLSPRLKDAARAGGVALAVSAALFLPFVASGRFDTGRYHWFVSSHPLLSHLVGAGTTFGWSLRLAQGALALTAGVVVAIAARRSRHAVWLVPCVVVAVRLLLDPLDSDYYFVAIEGPALVGLGLMVTWTLPSLRRRQLPARSRLGRALRST